MRASGYYFILERPRNRKPMEPKRVMNKVRIWDLNSKVLNKKGKLD